MRDRKGLWVFLLSLMWGCLGGETGNPAPPVPDDIGAQAESNDRSEVSSLLSSRSCTDGFFCNSACACDGGFCVPDGFGPSPPLGYCALPPQRACQGTGDCRSMCECWEGVCQPDGFGPSPPADYCAMPPPDANEMNDSVSEATAYLGAAQTHTFHERGDVDWIQVYFGSAGYATFETSHLNGAADTYMSLYRWDPAFSTYVFVSDNDNKCTWWWSTFCWGSRVSTNVAANSVYAVRLSNQGEGAMSIYDPEAPSYTFTVGF